MARDDETSPWSAIAACEGTYDPGETPAAGDPRAEAAMLLFESYISRYQAQALELRRDRD